MTDTDNDDILFRGTVLVTLRQGIRQSSRLARELAGDALIGQEALGLLGRLKAIDSELDDIARPDPDFRLANNDPFWNQPPHPFLREASGHSGM
ncbi:hypothetical protein V6R86_13255 [Sphingomonas kaistensis]|uniref:Uncharacterized protein n=1 Tax=Sphingomonas kaistensis TaxID=298708 RepID=A0ABZ2G6J8_9SPHN